MSEREKPFGARTSYQLLVSAKEGSDEALEALYRRYLPALTRWARGRLPRWARELVDTEDLVQETLLQSLQRVEHLEYRREGAFQAYLRRALVNRVHNEIRRAKRHPLVTTWGEEADQQPTILDQLVTKEDLQRFERAFKTLRNGDREAIIGRIEMGYSYRELADSLDMPSADAARMAVNRAIQRLIRAMCELDA